jgi:hypothetical protein
MRGGSVTKEGLTRPLIAGRMTGLMAKDLRTNLPLLGLLLT